MRTAPLEARRCATCGARRSGAYCSVCGQKAFPGPHTLRGLVRSVLERTINLEEGLAHTAHGLTVRPGEVVRDHWSGRTIRYTHPVPYFLLAVGVFALVFRLLSGPTGAADSDRLITVLVVPFMAAASRLLLWRARRNYAEHLIALLYLSGQSLVVATVLYLGVPLVRGDYIAAYAATALGLVLCYYLWAYARVFTDRLWIGAVAGLMSLIAGTAAWAGSVMALLAVLRS